MVFMEGGNTPSFKHQTYESAEIEAKRLAKQFNRKTFVLVSVSSFEINEFKVEDLRPCDLPF